MRMKFRAGSEGNRLGIVAAAITGLVVGFVAAASVGRPPAEESGTDKDARALMCTALDDLNSSFLQSMAEGEGTFGTAEHRRMRASLTAAMAYAEAAGRDGGADEDLLATVNDLHGALQRTRGDLARQHVDDLRAHC
jgi:hypothetical protein